MNELTTVIPSIPEVVFSIDPGKIKEIKDNFPLDTIPTDLTDKDNYAYVVKAIRVCRESRGQITKEHKDFKAPFIRAGKTCDLAKNTMLAELQNHEDGFKTVKVAFDNIEKDRLKAEERAKQEKMDAITTRISWINGSASRLLGKQSSDIYIEIVNLKADDLEWAGTMLESAKNVTANVIVQLENLYKLQEMAENVDKPEVEVGDTTSESWSEEIICASNKPIQPKDDRRTETLNALVEILRQEKPVAVLASEVLGKIESGDVSNLYFK